MTFYCEKVYPILKSVIPQNGSGSWERPLTTEGVLSYNTRTQITIAPSVDKG